jgi:hypothetical protein
LSRVIGKEFMNNWRTNSEGSIVVSTTLDGTSTEKVLTNIEVIEYLNFMEKLSDFMFMGLKNFQADICPLLNLNPELATSDDIVKAVKDLVEGFPIGSGIDERKTVST